MEPLYFHTLVLFDCWVHKLGVFIILKGWDSWDLIITTKFHHKPFSKQLQYPQSLQRFRPKPLLTGKIICISIFLWYAIPSSYPPENVAFPKSQLLCKSGSQCQQQLLSKNYGKSLFWIKLLKRLSKKPKWSHLYCSSQSPGLATAVLLTFQQSRIRDW